MRKTYAAERAADLDLSTHSGTDTDNGAGWLKLKLDKNNFINKVVIYYMFYTNWYNPSGYCAKSEDNFRKCVDNENNVDVSVYQGDVKQKSCGTLKLTYGLEQSDQIYTLICNSGGDTVTLNKNTGVISVCEVVVVVMFSYGKYALRIVKVFRSIFRMIESGLAVILRKNKLVRLNKPN